VLTFLLFPRRNRDQLLKSSKLQEKLQNAKEKVHNQIKILIGRKGAAKGEQLEYLCGTAAMTNVHGLQLSIDQRTRQPTT